MTLTVRSLVLAALKIVGFVLGLSTLRGISQLVLFRASFESRPDGELLGYFFATGLQLIAAGAVALMLLLQAQKVASWVMADALEPAEVDPGETGSHCPERLWERWVGSVV